MYSFDHVWRRGKVELTRVTDVQVQDLVPFAGDFVGDHSEIANGIAHIRHPFGSDNMSCGFRGHNGVLKENGDSYQPFIIYCR